MTQKMNIFYFFTMIFLNIMDKKSKDFLKKYIEKEEGKNPLKYPRISFFDRNLPIN